MNTFEYLSQYLFQTFIIYADVIIFFVLLSGVSAGVIIKIAGFARVRKGLGLGLGLGSKEYLIITKNIY